MLNEKDILIRLQNGEDPQKIANELADVLNAANKTYITQKEEEAKKKADEAKKNDLAKRDALQGIIDDFRIWVETYYDVKDLDAIFAEFNADLVIEFLKIVGEYYKSLHELKMALSPTVTPPVGTKNLAGNGANPDKMLDSFLKNMGW